jgi:hypothetical protein
MIRNPGRKATAATYAGKLVWDSSKQGTLRHSPPPTPRPARAPSAKKRLTKSVGGLRWTRRLKKFGGLTQLEERRLIDFALVGSVNPETASASQLEMLPGILEWLKEHPLRTLPQATKDYFGWV